MLSYLELKNFKSFSDIKLDLQKAHGEPKKTALIYGENGAGKSNLISSLLFLSQTFNTFRDSLESKDYPDILRESLNSMTDSAVKEDIIQKILRNTYTDLSSLVSSHKMLGNKNELSLMSLKFGFRIDGADGSYLLEFLNGAVVKEELRYQISEREGAMFSIMEDHVKLSPTIFFDTNYQKDLRKEIEQYWGKHTFMAILFNEIHSKNLKYIADNVNKNILKVIDWLGNFSVWCKQYNNEKARISIPFEFMQKLKTGVVEDRNDTELKLCETALNIFYTQLYSDIKSVHYEFSPKNNMYYYELHFTKLIDGELINVPISLESTGTQNLLEIFPILVASSSGASVFIDEIDSGIHDLLMKSIFESLNDTLKGQFIATTHNTLLMESLPPESIYILRVDAYGNKAIECIADYEDRTQKTNNIRKKYLRGDYEGVPYVGFLDFQGLTEDLLKNKQSHNEADVNGDEADTNGSRL